MGVNKYRGCYILVRSVRWLTLQRSSYQIPGCLFWVFVWPYVRRPLGSKQKHPSLAVPLANTSHSIDVDEGSPWSLSVSLSSWYLLVLWQCYWGKVKLYESLKWTINYQSIYMAHVMRCRKRFMEYAGSLASCSLTVYLYLTTMTMPDPSATVTGMH